MTKTRTVWKEKQRFKSYLDHNEIALDGEKQKGFGPKSLLLSALAACSGIDIVEILEKMRVSFTNFEIDVAADQTTKHPKVFKDINIIYKIKTDSSNEKKVRKAIELSLEKYCGVSAMLKKNSAIHYQLELS